MARFEPDVSRLGSLMTSSCRPQWALLRKDELLCGYIGPARTIAFVESALGTFAALEIHRPAAYESPRLLGRRLRFRAVISPAKIPRFLAAAAPLDWWADPAFGLVCGVPADSDQTERAALEFAGSVVFLDSAGSAVRIRLSDTEQSLLERLKTAFDPDGHLPPLPLTRKIVDASGSAHL